MRNRGQPSRWALDAAFMLVIALLVRTRHLFLPGRALLPQVAVIVVAVGLLILSTATGSSAPRSHRGNSGTRETLSPADRSPWQVRAPALTARQLHFRRVVGYRLTRGPH